MSYSTIFKKISSTIPNGFADAFEIVATDSLIFSFIFISGSFGRDSAGRLIAEDRVGTTALVFEAVGLGKEKGLDVGPPTGGGTEVGFWKIKEDGFMVGTPLSGVGVGWKTYRVGVGAPLSGVGVTIGTAVGTAVGGTGVLVGGATCPRRTSRGTGAVALPGIGQ